MKFPDMCLSNDNINGWGGIKYGRFSNVSPLYFAYISCRNKPTKN